MRRGAPGMRATLGDKLDRMQRRRRWRNGAAVGAALAATIVFAAIFIRPATPVGEELATVRDVRSRTLGGKTLQTSTVIDVVLDDGRTLVVANSFAAAPQPGSRIVLRKFSNVFGHIDYRWDGRVATEKARAP